MPMLIDKKKIPTHLKRSSKLTKEQKEEIQKRYLKGGVTQAALADEYKVSKRLIQFCIYPEKRAENYKRRVERGGSKIYYDTKKSTEAMKKHRAYKKELDKKGLL